MPPRRTDATPDYDGTSHEGNTMTTTTQNRSTRRLLAILALGTALATGTGMTAGADPGGRGRHGDRVVKATLTGAKERPGPGDRNGRGKARIELKRDRICFDVSWRRIGAPTAAHIHEGGRNEAGPVVVLLFAVPGGLRAPVHEVGGCTKADPGLIREIRRDPRDYYVNVHNEAFPNGAIRGQLHR